MSTGVPYFYSNISGAINSGVPRRERAQLFYKEIARPKSPILSSFIVVLMKMF